MDGLESVTVEMAGEAFAFSCNMKPEVVNPSRRNGGGDSGRQIWFRAARPSNIHTPKIIFLFGEMHVIVALPPKTLLSNANNVESGATKKRTVRNAPVVSIELWACLACMPFFANPTNIKHSEENHTRHEDMCLGGENPCPHPPERIVCSEPHGSNHENCSHRPSYSQSRGGFKRMDYAEVSRIRDQLKVIRNRMRRQ